MRFFGSLCVKYMHHSLYLGLIWLFVGCGYQPVSYYARSIFNDGVCVDIAVNPSVPESGTNIKDAVNNAVIKRFGSKLKSKQEAQSFLHINVREIIQAPVAYNQQGFVSYYRTHITLDIHFENTSGVSFDVTNTGYYDYSADFTSTIVLDQYRLESINNAANMALEKFISQVAYYGEFNRE
ncbi:LPS assembly lipoprotein LptE [Helicobacter sp.]|uniref:LPS assembly lipoprotein LptE n=1 Tax=Helicobacter sp. TaxID=218 RepID=UPI0025C73E66|nr:LPS assembly lipoprotein LptE [Helicobacter sp.]